MKNDLLIKKVWINKSSGVKFVTIPSDRDDIKEGDYVKIEKINK